MSMDWTRADMDPDDPQSQGYVPTSEPIRDRLAAALGPGNDDVTAYTQADAVLEILAQWDAERSEAGDTPWDDTMRAVTSAAYRAGIADVLQEVDRVMPGPGPRGREGWKDRVAEKFGVTARRSNA